MLEEKIKLAREKSAKQRKQLVVGGILLLLCCLSIVALFFLRPFSSEISGEKEQIDAIAEEVSTDGQEELRSQFKELALQYENNIESQLDGLNDWQRERVFALGEKKKSAITSYGNGEYQKGIDGFIALEADALLLFEEAEAVFSGALAQSRSSFKDDDYQQAKVHIEQALFIKPTDSKALALQQQIEKLPVLLPFLKGAKVAVAENNIQKEYEALLGAQLLAPERHDIETRLLVLKELLRKHSFENHIAQGFIAVENGLATDAWFHYQQAKIIDPARKEITLLFSKIKLLEKNNRVRLGLEKAQQAIRRDDWQSAHAAFARVAKDEPQNKKVREGLQKSQYILGMQKEAKNYLRDPYRLANSKVGEDVAHFLVRVQPATQMSYSLQRQTKALREKLALFNRVLPVRVLSDGKTNVTVRGVGKVGQVMEKTIQLKPGNYVFEGERRGYISKLVSVLIPYDVQNFQLQVICDEPI